MLNPPRRRPPRTGLTERVAEQILDLVRSGAAATSGRLPSERALAERFHVSRTTLRAALRLLAEQGHVSAAAQSGWYANAAPYGPPPRQLLSFTEMARRRGFDVETTIIRREIRQAGLEEREQLEPREDDRVLVLERVRSIEGTPICVEHAVIALWLVPDLEQEDFENQSLYELLEKHGSRPTRSDFAISAALAGSKASMLGVSPAEPVLIGEELSYNQFHAPILQGIATYRAESYRFQSTLIAPPASS